MKTRIIFSNMFVKSLAVFIPAAFFSFVPPAMSMGGEPDNLPMPQAGSASQQMNEAQRQFEKGASEFSPDETRNVKSPQRTGQTTWSDVHTSPAPATKHPPQTQREDPRASSLMGSPETGYAGTWTDPATGDIITSVIAPAPVQSQSQNYPIIVEPQVTGGSWGNSWNSGWPQWGNYVGEPGYGTNPPPPPPGFQPGFNKPGPGFPGNGLGQNKPPTGMGPYFPPTNMVPNFPPPAHPGYRPLRPNLPNHGFNRPNAGMNPPNQGFNPPNAGFNPPNQGFNPPNQGFIPPNNGMNTPNFGQPPVNQPNNPSIWHPGPNVPNQGWQPMNPPQAFNPQPGNGFMPGNPPGWKPLPMRPGGMGMPE